MKINKTITQNNFFMYYAKEPNNDENIRERALNLGQKLKSIISDSYIKQAVLKKLNGIATQIQNKINRANLIQADIEEYRAELYTLLNRTAFILQDENINIFFQVCILLSKHETEEDTVSHKYFLLLPNKTTYLEKLSETNDTFSEFDILTPDDVTHLLGNVISKMSSYEAEAIELIQYRFRQQSIIKAKANISEKMAAIRIQSLFRGYSVRHNNINRSPEKQLLVDSKIRQRIHKHMQTISEIFKTVLSAQFVNKDNSWKDNLDEFRKIRKSNKSAIAAGIANCGEVARTLYMLIKTDPLIPDRVKDNMHLGGLSGHDDHTCVIIGSLDDTASYIADIWIKFINLSPRNGYRAVNSQATQRNIGFFGIKTDYIKFLRAHEDGKYIKKWALHQFIIRTFSFDEQEVIKTDLEQYFTAVNNKVKSEEAVIF